MNKTQIEKQIKTVARALEAGHHIKYRNQQVKSVAIGQFCIEVEVITSKGAIWDSTQTLQLDPENPYWADTLRDSVDALAYVPSRVMAVLRRRPEAYLPAIPELPKEVLAVLEKVGNDPVVRAKFGDFLVATGESLRKQS